MSPPRLPDAEKRLRGTLYPSNSERNLVHGRVAIVEPIAPPHGLSAAEKLQWQLHMSACLSAGTLASSNLLAFRAMVQLAATRDQALQLAQAQAPVVRDKKGSVKANPVWKTAMAADARYLAWTVQFGLTPNTGKNLPRLPVPGGTRLRAVR